MSQAIVIEKAGSAKVTDVGTPKLRDDYILVKVHSVALNPTDWKHIDYLADAGARVGCDYAGTVLEIGSKVNKSFKKGDKVCGFIHGGNAVQHEDGAFQTVAPAKGDIQIKIPENVSFEEASTLGVGVGTVGQGLYQSLKLPAADKPTTKSFPLLIYGGSTATGALAIQYAKLSGLEVITTCSPANFDYVKSLGADAVFDYKDAKCAEQIKEHTKNGLEHVFDCISTGNSPDICVAAMSDQGGVYSTLLPVPGDKVAKINDKVKNQSTLAYTSIGESFKFGANELPAKPEDLEFAKDFWELSRRLLEQGKVKVHRVSVNEGGSGLQGVMHGLQYMREGKLSGKKLVYHL